MQLGLLPMARAYMPEQLLHYRMGNDDGPTSLGDARLQANGGRRPSRSQAVKSARPPCRHPLFPRCGTIAERSLQHLHDDSRGKLQAASGARHSKGLQRLARPVLGTRPQRSSVI